MKRNKCLVPILMMAFTLSLTTGLRAQTQPPAEAAISVLAERIARPLQEAHVTKVIFADLKGPDGQTHPAGRWFADQLAISCNKSFPNLEVILRPPNDDLPASADGSQASNEPSKSLEDWARGMGANVFIRGTFARWSDGIGVSLFAMTSSESPREVSQATGLIPMSDAITSLSQEAIPEPKGGVPRAGIAGAGVPKCLHCPPPKYSSDARKARVEGSVVLEATITLDGRATSIKIVKDAGYGLGMQAIETVRKWRFKPANGPDGKPVAVICPIEVTFRLFK